MKAYCMKCKKQNEVQNPQEYMMTSKRNKNGVKAVKGFCSVCAGKVNKILPKEGTKEGTKENG